MILHDSNVIVTSITGLNEHLIDKSIKTGFFVQGSVRVKKTKKN